MDRQFKIVNYSYNEMKADLLSIIQGIESTSWKPDVIVGLTRGGLVPAVMVSHYFEIPLIPVNLSLRDFKSDMNNVINEIKQSMETTLLDSKNILVMDDILDSGATMAELKVIFEKLHDMQVVKELDNIKYATLYYNYANNAEFIPDYYARQIDKSLRDDWIVFPFEQWWKE